MVFQILNLMFRRSSCRWVLASYFKDSYLEALSNIDSLPRGDNNGNYKLKIVLLLHELLTNKKKSRQMARFILNHTNALLNIFLLFQ